VCDFKAGEVLVAFDAEDSAGHAVLEQLRRGPRHPEPADDFDARIRRIGRPWMAYRTSMRDHLESHELPWGHTAWRHELHLVEVREGAEQVAAAHLSMDYAEAAIAMGTLGSGFHAQPNTFLRAQAGPRAHGEVQFDLQAHGDFLTMVGLNFRPPPARRPSVVVIDSGAGLMAAVATDVGPDRELSVIDPPGVSMRDVFGHGSLVCGIIKDACPAADVTSIRVFEDALVPEWNVLAALLTSAVEQADVVNISLEFGMSNVDCPRCGRTGHSARSAVFERILNDVTMNSDAIIVAAAGNGNLDRLAYPARYGSVVGIGSLTSTCAASSFTNVGAWDEDEAPHSYVFFAPGGETNEAVGHSNTDGFWGTSFAAAYATAVVVTLATSMPHRSDVLERLRATSGRSGFIHDYDPQIHGNGLIRYV